MDESDEVVPSLESGEEVIDLTGEEEEQVEEGRGDLPCSH